VLCLESGLSVNEHLDGWREVGILDAGSGWFGWSLGCIIHGFWLFCWEGSRVVLLLDCEQSIIAVKETSSSFLG
jgi:hypothetical protein